MNKRNSERLFTKDYILIMLAATGTSLCNFFFFTALPLYAERISGSDLYSGLMLTVYSIAALAARPVTGILSDKIGRVRLLLAGALVCAVCCAFYGVTTAIILLLAIRVLNGLGFGVHSTMAGAVVADVIPKSRMSEGIGYFSMYATLSTAIGPFIALKIVGDGELHSYRTLFFVASGLCLMSLAADSLITYERKARRESETRAIAEPAAETDRGAEEADGPAGPLPRTFLGFEYAVFLPVVVLILLNFASSSLNTFLTLFAQERTLGNIGVFFTINAAGLFISRLLFGRLADRRGPDIVVIPGIVGLALCYGIIPFIQTPVWLFVLGFPIGLAGGAILPSINALIFRRCSPQRRGTASAAYFAALDIGFAIGGTAFGFIAERLGYSYIYWAAAGLALLAVLVYVKADAENKRRWAGKRVEGAL
jgi:MFS family permease